MSLFDWRPDSLPFTQSFSFYLQGTFCIIWFFLMHNWYNNIITWKNIYTYIYIDACYNFFIFFKGKMRIVINNKVDNRTWQLLEFGSESLSYFDRLHTASFRWSSHLYYGWYSLQVILALLCVCVCVFSNGWC